MTSPTKPARSTARSAARLAAVQALYQHDMEATPVAQLLHEFHQHRLGTTIDVILVNGWLHVGDTIILQGFNGPIVTKVRALLTPQPMRELRIKAEYVHHTQIKGSMGIKISAPELEHALAGAELFCSHSDQETQEYVEQI